MHKTRARFVIAGLSVVALTLAFTVYARIARSGSGSDDLGGKVVLPGGNISNTNPCNGANVAGTGNLTATGIVTVVGDDSEQRQVFVSVTYDAPGAKGSDGNTYNVHGAAHAIYDTLAGGGYYDLPMNLDYDSVNNHTLSFRESADAFVDVDQNQHPTTLPAVGRSAVCDGR